MRLFFALWPDDDVRRRIAASPAMALAAAAGRAVPASRLHLTLAFLGTLPAERVADAQDVGDRCRGRPFELSLDRLGYWPGPRVCWLGCRTVPPALGALARDLRGHLDDAGLEVRDQDFVPHVTLARHASAPPAGQADAAAPAPLHWPVHGFALIRSRHDRDGLHYRPLSWWPLRADAR